MGLTPLNVYVQSTSRTGPDTVVRMRVAPETAPRESLRCRRALRLAGLGLGLGISLAWLCAGGCSHPVGRPDPRARSRARPLPGHRFTTLAMGLGFTCALRVDGTLWCWGKKHCAIRGGGKAGERPRHVTGIPRVRHIAAGRHHACAVGTDGSLWCWGALDAFGKPHCEPRPRRADGIHDALAVSAADASTCVVRRGGRVTCSDNAFPFRDVGVRGAVSVSMAESHRCALFGNGTVACWRSGAPDPVVIAYPETKGDGVTLEPKKLEAVVALASGSADARGEHRRTLDHICALRRDGTVWCWGYNNGGQLGLGKNRRKCRFDTHDGTDAWCREVPTKVRGLSRIRSITAGGEYTCALQRVGSPGRAARAWCWGSNPDGRLGDGTVTRRFRPVRVKGPSGFRTIAASPSVCTRRGCEAHTCALTRQGQAWCWGHHKGGRLGTIRASVQRTPLEVSPLETEFSATAGWYRELPLGPGSRLPPGSRWRLSLGPTDGGYRSDPQMAAIARTQMAAIARTQMAAIARTHRWRLSLGPRWRLSLGPTDGGYRSDPQMAAIARTQMAAIARTQMAAIARTAMASAPRTRMTAAVLARNVKSGRRRDYRTSVLPYQVHDDSCPKNAVLFRHSCVTASTPACHCTREPSHDQDPKEVER